MARELVNLEQAQAVLYVQLKELQNLVKLGAPFPALEEQVEEQMSRADLCKNLPRGRKRRGLKKEFLQSLSDAAKDMGEISEEEILRTIRRYRAGKCDRKPPLPQKS